MLHLVAKEGMKHFIKPLIENGANVLLKNKDGKTAREYTNAKISTDEGSDSDLDEVQECAIMLLEAEAKQNKNE